MKHLLIISLLLTSSLFAEFKVGDKLPTITLEDQFEKSQKITSKDKMIIMAFEKDISIAIADYLKTKPDSFLATHNTKYISDISSMPSFITSMFALPKMKKYNFSVMLIDNDFGEKFNRKEGKITLFKIKNKKIKEIQFINPSKLSKVFQ